MYTDEVEPGNELAARHERKLYAFYFAIRECGPLILSNTDAWITLAAHASHEVHQVAGGLPAIMAVLLESMFTGVHSMREVGVVLNAPDGRHKRVFFLIWQCSSWTVPHTKNFGPSKATAACSFVCFALPFAPDHRRSRNMQATVS